jgi:hypothetical protein
MSKLLATALSTVSASSLSNAERRQKAAEAAERRAKSSVHPSGTGPDEHAKVVTVSSTIIKGPYAPPLLYSQQNPEYLAYMQYLHRKFRKDPISAEEKDIFWDPTPSKFKEMVDDGRILPDLLRPPHAPAERAMRPTIDPLSDALRMLLGLRAASSPDSARSLARSKLDEEFQESLIEDIQRAQEKERAAQEREKVETLRLLKEEADREEERILHSEKTRRAQVLKLGNGRESPLSVAGAISAARGAQPAPEDSDSGSEYSYESEEFEESD